MRRLSILVLCAGVLAACASPAPSPPLKPQTPPMGWNSWNSGIALNERAVKDTIDAMVSSGMRDAGYRYVNLDAGWAAPTRDADGNLRADQNRFPHGIAALAAYAHDRGMLLGIYHSPFNQGCGQDPRIGGAGHEVHREVFVELEPTRGRGCRLERLEQRGLGGAAGVDRVRAVGARRCGTTSSATSSMVMRWPPVKVYSLSHQEHRRLHPVSRTNTQGSPACVDSPWIDL